MICDALEHLNRYRGLHRNLDTAIDYFTAYHVAHDLSDLPLGRTEVDGENVFINVMDADLHPDEGSHLEYHHKYADLQIDLTGQVAAVSCGIVGGQPLLDLDYPEDSHADVDLNLVCTDAGGIVEVQGTGEGRAFTPREQQELVALCAQVNARLIELEKNILGEIL